MLPKCLIGISLMGLSCLSFSQVYFNITNQEKINNLGNINPNWTKFSKVSETNRFALRRMTNASNARIWYTIYDISGKELFNIDNSSEMPGYNFSFSKSGHLYLQPSQNTVNKYDQNGQLVLQYKNVCPEIGKIEHFDIDDVENLIASCNIDGRKSQLEAYDQKHNLIIEKSTERISEFEADGNLKIIFNNSNTRRDHTNHSHLTSLNLKNMESEMITSIPTDSRAGFSKNNLNLFISTNDVYEANGTLKGIFSNNYKLIDVFGADRALVYDSSGIYKVNFKLPEQKLNCVDLNGRYIFTNSCKGQASPILNYPDQAVVRIEQNNCDWIKVYPENQKNNPRTIFFSEKDLVSRQFETDIVNKVRLVDQKNEDKLSVTLKGQSLDSNYFGIGLEYTRVNKSFAMEKRQNGNLKVTYRDYEYDVVSLLIIPVGLDAERNKSSCEWEKLD